MEKTIQIENERMQIEISNVGAEPVLLWDKKQARNVLWRGDPRFWKRHDPILFPNVGKMYRNEFRHQGNLYTTSQHGFARDRVFSCIVREKDKVVHRLVSDDATRENYPFDFALAVIHKLEGNSLWVEWQVTNTGKQPMYFTIGGHPAFSLLKNSLNKDAYELLFPGTESLVYHLIDPQIGNPRPGETQVLTLQDHRLPLSDALFQKDALIFDDGQISEVQLWHQDGTRLVTLNAEGFPNFGIWSVAKAPFVCLEPWIGRTDDAGFKNDISQKPGITKVDPGQCFSSHYTITL